MPLIFSGLENRFAGPGWTWKHKKWKDQKFLHRNCIPQKFSTLRKNKILLDQKNPEKKRNFWSNFFCPQNRKISKCQNIEISIFDIFSIFEFRYFDILTFFRFCGQFFFEPKCFGFFFGKFFDRAKIYFFSELRIFFGIQFRCKNFWSFHFLCFQVHPGPANPFSSPLKMSGMFWKVSLNGVYRGSPDGIWVTLQLFRKMIIGMMKIGMEIYNMRKIFF